MRIASANATRVVPELVAILRVPASRLREAVPVPLQPLDPFAEAEPSIGATIQLENDRHVVVIYGLETQQLLLHAEPAVARQAIDDFLAESGLNETAIEWIRTDFHLADVNDRPELLKVISTYNDMFGRLFEALKNEVGEDQARDIFMTTLQNAKTDELWTGVFFDQHGRFDENVLIANISELPFEQRKTVLDIGLNTLLSLQLFEVSQHLDQAGKVNVFRFISDQKASLEKAAV